MNLHRFISFKDKILKLSIFKDKYLFLNKLSSRAIKYYAGDLPFVFEIGFEEQGPKLIKLLLIGIPFRKPTRAFVRDVFSDLSSCFPQWKNNTSDLTDIVRLLYAKKALLYEDSFHLAFEFRREKLKFAKIYFSQSKLNTISDGDKEYCLEFRHGKVRPTVKFYREISGINKSNAPRSKKFFNNVRFEGISRQIKQTSLLSMLHNNKIAKLGLRFRGEGIKNKKAKLYFGLRKDALPEKLFAQLFTDKRPKLASRLTSWFVKMNGIKKMTKTNFSYVAFGQDGFEAYLR